MNKSKGNMYGFITHTWNPIKGKCRHDCNYCYMKRWGKQKSLSMNQKELHDLGSNNFIFVGSSTDMFALDVPCEWITEVLDHCGKYDNTYLFQTKNPKRFEMFFDDMKTLGLKFILCTTIETDRIYSDQRKVPSSWDRSYHMKFPCKKMVTIEPIMDFDLDTLIKYIKRVDPFQVNIGADSQKSNLPEPSSDKIKALIIELEKFTKVHLKDNIGRLMK